ncbi:MAG: DinB family protein [Bacteroidota bacterium]|nr:DinB family protein [Bacteroidota bacterium]
MENLIDTWIINQKMNRLLVLDTKEEWFADRSVAKGRSVGEQLAHIHNVRLMWLKVAIPELLSSQKKFEKETPLSKQVLMEEMGKSSEAIISLLRAGFSTGRIKGFKPHPEAFLGYMIAHEAHHRGQIILILKENGHIPGKKTLYGLWEWGTK